MWESHTPCNSMSRLTMTTDPGDAGTAAAAAPAPGAGWTAVPITASRACCMRPPTAVTVSVPATGGVDRRMGVTGSCWVACVPEQGREELLKAEDWQSGCEQPWTVIPRACMSDAHGFGRQKQPCVRRARILHSQSQANMLLVVKTSAVKCRCMQISVTLVGGGLHLELSPADKPASCIACISS
jgi:hypothetical protein